MADRRRRVRCSRDVWAQRVAAWRRSGFSAESFSRRRGLACATLRWWAWKLGAAKSAAAAAGFVAVELESGAGSGGYSADSEPFEVTLANGVSIRLSPAFDEAALRRLLDCLGERRPC